MADAPVSFEKDIKPLFTDDDVAHMKDEMGWDLCDYDTVKANADDIDKRLKDPKHPMPPKSSGGPWRQEWIQKFEAWMQGNYQP